MSAATLPTTTTTTDLSAAAVEAGAELGAYYGEGRNWRYVLFNRHGGSSATGTSSRTAALLALKDAGAEAIYVDNGDAYELEWSHR